MPAPRPVSDRSLRTLRVASAAAVAASMPLIGVTVMPAAALPAAAAEPASATQCRAVTSADMSWGIKQSLRNYITGPIAGGHWDLDNVTYTGANNAEDGAFHFTADPARSAVDGDAADLPMPGTLKLNGHGGIINVTLTNFTLQVRGTKAQLLADGRYLGTDPAALSSIVGGAPAFVQQPVATFTLDQTLTQAGAQNGSATLTGSSWIHENLNKGMLGAYGEGKNDGDPVTVNIATAPGGDCAVDHGAAMATSPGQPDSNEAAATPTPQQATPAAPGAATQQAAPQATTTGQPAETGTCGTVNSASVGWGLKKSFRSYLTGPIAGGHWDLDGVGFAGSEGGDDGAFQFSADPSAVKVSGQDADIPLQGSVHLTGHLGALDITYTNMSVKVRGTTAQFIADYRSNTVSSFTAGASVTGAKTGTQVPIAQFNLAQPISGGAMNLTGPGYITEDGNQSLGGQYGEGNNEADPINIGLDTSGDCAGAGLSGLQSAGAANSGGAATSGDVSTGTPDLGISSAPRVVGGGAATTGGAGSSDSTCEAADGDRKVVEDRMGWGIKESFRAYIKGSIAKGDWTTGGGAVYSEGNFVFSGSDGSVKVDGGSVSSGTLKFGGSVLFTGHEGVLRTTISDPEIRIDGNGGTLVANVQSNDTSGNPQDFGRIAVADLSIDAASVKDDILDGSASASLSQDGATALAGFYEPGSALDPVSFRAALSSGCDDESTASLGDKPEDEDAKDKDEDAKNRADRESGKVTVHDSADEGNKDDEDTGLAAFFKDPASVIPSAIALIAVIIAGIFGVQLRRTRTDGQGEGSDEGGAEQ